MQYRIVADENVHAGIVSAIRAAGHSVVSIRESSPGISDVDVLAMCMESDSVLVTEDSDFGELVFSHGLPGVGILYLRYAHSELKKITANLIKVLDSYDVLANFCVISADKIRIRRLPVR